MCHAAVCPTRRSLRLAAHALGEGVALAQRFVTEREEELGMGRRTAELNTFVRRPRARTGPSGVGGGSFCGGAPFHPSPLAAIAEPGVGSGKESRAIRGSVPLAADVRRRVEGCPW